MKIGDVSQPIRTSRVPVVQTRIKNRHTLPFDQAKDQIGERVFRPNGRASI
jgi:hypothetical protein